MFVRYLPVLLREEAELIKALNREQCESQTLEVADVDMLKVLSVLPPDCNHGNRRSLKGPATFTAASLPAAQLPPPA